MMSAIYWTVQISSLERKLLETTAGSKKLLISNFLEYAT